jgi:hypothetical protein
MKVLFLCAVFSAYLPYAAAADAPKAGAAFPVVDPATQRARDETRKQILEEEQATEKERWGKVKAELAAAEGAGKPQGEIAVLKDALRRHEANLTSLNQELLRAGQQQGTSRPIKVATTRPAAPVQLRASVESEAQAESPAPYWDVYRRQASNRSEGETKTKMQLTTN